ncbi:ABC-type sugar transport system ATPase subunit [Deinococcus metalli]|uniref:ABC-type sugar transport system ATPase subunit n=1 Tax=Deinococcus metalli TaxID=1141878 RepID=A0A7W8KET7_9DEIO|nr:sugar ABC transporter ATP-binding protein [Deinococcus metalli]MBB5376453.1 ABC-type sugar transport system ATPase subunit [Deinococcus metalli]GHF43925.1 ribose import ATP-binding protein RbsA [Deinococcus metalli]
MSAAPLLTLRGVTRTFGAHAALQAVDLSLGAGEVHGLVGENGAGKSTLIKVLSGLYPPSAGELLWDGVPAHDPGPEGAQARGIRVVHQERQLVPGFSVLENLYLGSAYPRRGWGVDWSAMRRAARALQDEWGVHVPLDEPAQHLTPTQRTMTEVLRAVMVRSRLLILDEPTASLTHHDAELLFTLIRRLRSEGTAVLYVSHRLAEVLDLADHLTVLRGGRVAARFRRGEADAARLVEAMSGPATTRPDRRTDAPANHPTPGGQALLAVEHLATRDGRVRDVSFTLRAGEILGVYGLGGAGRTELLEALAGLRVRGRGTVRWDDGARPVLIPEDRRQQGLVGHLSVRENMTLATLADHTTWGVVRRAREQRAVAQGMGALTIRASGPEQPVEELSGGNQQKVLFARALAGRPRVWLCDEPTQAVDVMTRRAIHDLLREQARAGAGVVFVTSDLGELLDIADRVAVLRAGRTVADLTGEERREDAVLRACYGEGGADAGE